MIHFFSVKKSVHHLDAFLLALVLNMKICCDRYPLLPVSLLVLAGVVCADVSRHGLSLSGVMSVGACSLLVALLTWRRPVGRYFVLLPWFFVGMVALLRAERRLAVGHLSVDGIHEMVVVEEPVVGEQGVSAVVELVSGDWVGRKARVTCVGLDKESNISPVALGEGIVARCSLRPTEELRNESFRRYLKVHDIAFVGRLMPWQYRSKALPLDGLPKWDRVMLLARQMRHRWVDKLGEAGLSGQQLAVVAAMTIGDKSRLTAATKDMFSAAGTSHLLALSGTHLAILYAVLSLLLRDFPFLLGRGRLLVCEFISLSLVWGYVWLVGLSPSVVRAAMMITVLSLARMAGRGHSPVNTLSLAALLMVSVDAMSVFDVSFQLSFLSVLSIVTLVPLFDGWLAALFPSDRIHETFSRRQSPAVRYLLMSTMASLAAQIGTAPLVLYHFGVCSFCSVVANWMAIPLTTVILYLSLGFFLAVVLPTPASVGAFLSAMLTLSVSLLMRIHEAIASLPFAMVSGARVNLLQVILMYVVIILFLEIVERIVQIRQKSIFAD